MSISNYGFRTSSLPVSQGSGSVPPLRKGGQGGSGDNVLSHADAKSRSSILHPQSSTRPGGLTHQGAGTDSKRIGPPGSPGRRAGFTLVEMLVAVGLVVLMMTLFATIFQMATGAMSVQKGLAENDQRDRLVLTRLRNDLNGNKSDPNDPNRPYRTFGWVVPWGPDEVKRHRHRLKPAVRPIAGYFYISENDPNDDTDDVLALTVQFPSRSSEPVLRPSRDRVSGRDGNPAATVRRGQSRRRIIPAGTANTPRQPIAACGWLPGNGTILLAEPARVR